MAMIRLDQSGSFLSKSATCRYDFHTIDVFLLLAGHDIDQQWQSNADVPAFWRHFFRINIWIGIGFFLGHIFQCNENACCKKARTINTSTFRTVSNKKTKSKIWVRKKSNKQLSTEIKMLDCPFNQVSQIKMKPTLYQLFTNLRLDKSSLDFKLPNLKRSNTLGGAMLISWFNGFLGIPHQTHTHTHISCSNSGESCLVIYEEYIWEDDWCMYKNKKCRCPLASTSTFGPLGVGQGMWVLRMTPFVTAWNKT